ncbi:MAG TPA: thioesterase family protein [Acidobacteriota bacterium]|nr:thioesterase family protein [Acidobacteriota bacterium]
MAHEFKLKRRVEFFETDMAGIMHFSNFFRWMEAAEVGFFRTLGLSLHPGDGQDSIGWPKVHVECDYYAPLRFEDLVEVHLLVREKSLRSVSYRFIFRKLNESPIREVAQGAVISACVTHNRATGRIEPVPIPKEIADLIDDAPHAAAD